LSTEDPIQTRHFFPAVFGPTRHATEEEKALIERLVDDCPAAVFGALNQRLNQRRLLITLDALPFMQQNANEPAPQITKSQHRPVFQALLPSGVQVTVAEDGSVSGLPEGTWVVNHFVRRYTLCEALLKKCVDAGLVTNDQAAGLMS
jgi:hypothetical protein